VSRHYFSVDKAWPFGDYQRVEVRKLFHGVYWSNFLGLVGFGVNQTALQVGRISSANDSIPERLGLGRAPRFAGGCWRTIFLRRGLGIGFLLEDFSVAGQIGRRFRPLEQPGFRLQPMSKEITAESAEEILPGLFRWEAFSPEHKVEMTSHAVILDGKVFCFDPIALADEPFERVSGSGRPAGIILTNDNHERDCLAWRERWQVPIWAAANAVLTVPGVQRFALPQAEWEGFRLHPLTGAGGGELAFRLMNQSLVLAGDAVINLPSRGLELLPEKYCRDQTTLRRNLGLLLAEPFERMVMAHGTPILGKASQKLVPFLRSEKV
jgi:hypothetical protein